MDSLRQGIGLRGYAQVDPKTEYKREGLAQFEDMLFRIADEVTDYILRVQISSGDEERLARAYSGAEARHPAPGAGSTSVSTGPVQRRAAPQQRRVAVGYQPPKQESPLQKFAREREELEAASLPPEAVAAERRADSGAAKVARNAPCPCGSGKKYKQCHGRGA